MGYRCNYRAWAMAGAATAALFIHGSAAAQTEPSTLDEIVVTGSRLAGSTAELASQPVQVLTAEALQARGVTNVTEALDRVPALITSTTTAQAAESTAPALNLRGLGTNRTLVLVNGRRHVSGSAGSAAVDTTTIPSGLVEQVEVLTGGASAVYGSDAVTGVVNFILKKDYEGDEVEFQAGVSGEGDGTELHFSGLHGRNFAGGRGNVTLAIQASESKAVFAGDRDFSRGNRRANDYANPALFFQPGDPLPPGVSAATAVGRTILVSGNPRFANTPAELVTRARTAAPRAFLEYPTFFISSNTGLIGIDPYGFGFPGGPGDFANLQDTDRNGVDDCLQSRNGRTFFGCWVTDATTGEVRPFRDGLFAGSSNQFGGDGAAETYDGESLTPTETLLSVNLNLNYEVSSYFRPFAELKAVANRTVNYNPYSTFDDATPISLDNPFIPAAIRALVNAELAADPSLAETMQVTIARDHADIFDPRSELERRTYRAVVGFTGEFGNGWDYELSANYGRTEQEYKAATRLEDRFFAAVDAVIDPRTGQPVCRSTLDPTALPPYSFLTDTDNYPGDIGQFGGFRTFDPRSGACAPLNLFGANMASQAARDFLNYYATDTSTIEQTVVSGFLIGDSEPFFSLPGGPLEFVVGAEYRKETSDYQPDPYTEAGYVFQYIPTAAVSGEFDVKEAYAEIGLPLISGQPWTDLLRVTLAGRLSEYSTVGRTSTWKVDGIWAPVPDVRFRAGYATTVRAPNISELFSPLDSATFRPVDPCDAAEIGNGSEFREANCRQDLGLAATGPYNYIDPLTARFNGQTGGNPNLEEEESTSYTIGVVFRPSFIPGFRASADYWNIKIEKAIAAVSAQDIVDSCYDAPTLENQYCTLFTRNRNAGSLTYLGFNYLLQTQLNFSGLEASGVDFSLGYELPMDRLGLDEWGTLDFGVDGTWMEKRNDFPFVQDPDEPNPELGEINYPEWAVNGTVRWRVGDFTASFFTTYLSSQALTTVEIENAANYAPAFSEESFVHDASLKWEVRDDVDLTVGVKNLTNETPYMGSLATPVSGVGRYFFFRVVARR